MMTASECVTLPAMRWALALVLVACSYDRAEWRPAHPGADPPATKDAFRIHEPDAMCEKLGVVEATGGRELERISETAARHGATHYVVSGDQTSTTAYVTNGQVTPTGQVKARTYVERSRTVTAIAYRCP